MPADTLEPIEAIETKLRTTLRAVADQTDVGEPGEPSVVAAVIELGDERGRRRGLWLAAAACVALLALASIVVTRIDRETSVQSAATSTPPAPAAFASQPPLVATYVPSDFVAHPWQLGTASVRQPVRIVGYVGD